MSSEQAWNEARRNVTALGEQLRQHYETGGPEEAAKRVHLEAAVDGLGRAVTEVLDSLGKVLDDPEVRTGSAKVAQSFSQAVAVTFAEVGAGLQQALRRTAPATTSPEALPDEQKPQS
jgi:hypothetical protein